MCNYHVKAIPEIFETYFLSIAQAHNYNTQSKSNQSYFLDHSNTNSGQNLIQFHCIHSSNMESDSFGK